MEMKIFQHDAGHITKMAAMPELEESLKAFFPDASGMIPTKLGM